MADDLNQLIEKYTSPFRPSYAECDGIFMTPSFADNCKKILNFEVRDDDVWVTSFPKAGTTWTQEMVWMIANDLDYEGAKADINQRFPYLEIGDIMDFKGGMKNIPDIPDLPDLPFSEMFADVPELFKNMKTRRFIKSHLPWKLLPLQIQNQNTKAKIIHVMRNPKDVCVSFYYHSKMLEGANITFEEFFKLFMAGKVLYGPYWDNILSYWDRRHLPNLLIIFYEDMKRDLPSVIAKVAKFLNKEVNESQMEKLVKHLSFEEMKKNPAVNNEMGIGMIQKLSGNETGGKFMRAGVVGSHKVEMTDDMIRMVDNWTKRYADGYGLTFAT